MRLMILKAALTLSFLCFGSISPAQTVLDMYHDIPRDLLGVLVSPDESKKSDQASRRAALKIVDVKNGYLESHGNVQIVKFSMAKMPALLAVAGSSYADSGRTSRLQFFRKHKGKWEDVTRYYYQEIPDLVTDALFLKKCRKNLRLSDSASGTWRISLPRTGRTIRAIVESDVANCKAPLFFLEFTEGRLVFNF